MAEQQTVDAALAWADRIARGDADSYDPYIVALAQVVREQREYINGLEKLTGIADGGGDAQQMVVDYGAMQDRIVALETALRPFAEKFDLYASDHLTLEGADYRVFPAAVVQEIARAMATAKITLAR